MKSVTWHIFVFSFVDARRDAGTRSRHERRDARGMQNEKSHTSLQRSFAFVARCAHRKIVSGHDSNFSFQYRTPDCANVLA